MATIKLTQEEALKRIATILEGTPLLAPGTEGIKGVTIANAMHLSSWLGKDIELPFSEDLFLAELNKKIEEEAKNKEEVFA